MRLRRRLTDAERDVVKGKGTSRTKGLLILIVTIVILAALPIFLFERPETFFDVNGSALASSVEDDLPETPNVRECRFEDKGVWSCPVERNPGRPPEGLKVKLDDDRCWDAVKSPANGCIGLMDYVLDEPAFFE